MKPVYEKAEQRYCSIEGLKTEFLQHLLKKGRKDLFELIDHSKDTSEQFGLDYSLMLDQIKKDNEEIDLINMHKIIALHFAIIRVKPVFELKKTDEEMSNTLNRSFLLFYVISFYKLKYKKRNFESLFYNKLFIQKLFSLPKDTNIYILVTYFESIFIAYSLLDKAAIKISNYQKIAPKDIGTQYELDEAYINNPPPS